MIRFICEYSKELEEIELKKIISIALILVMLFAVTASVSVAALPSPEAEDEYNIVVDAEGNGSGTTNKNKVVITDPDEDGIVTLTADPDGGYFTLWIIDGDYDIIEGSVNDPVMKIKPKSNIHATANFREDKDYLTIVTKTIGDGTASTSVSKVPLDQAGIASVTLTAKDGKDTFVDWTLECKYDVVEGNNKTRVLVIKPYTDIIATAKFVGGTDSDVTPGNKDTNKTSPKTGDPLFVVIGLFALALGTAVVAVKKIKE